MPFLVLLASFWLAAAAQAQIAFRAATSAFDSSQNQNGFVTINKPAGTVQNDVMVASIAYRDSTVTISPPANWNLIRNVSQPSGGSGSGMRLATYYRVVSASEASSYTWTFNNNNYDSAVGGIAGFSGVNTASPIDVENGAATANSQTHATPTVTPTANSEMLVSIMSYASSGTWTTPVGGWTKDVDAASETPQNSVGISMSLNHLLQATAAAISASATATAQTDNGAGEILALKPGTPLLAAPTVAKSFSPSTITAGGTSTLSITLTNPNATAITGAAFTDSYPANLVNSGTPGLSNSCGGAATAAANGTSLSLSGGTIPALGSCSVGVNVTSASGGSYNNSTGAVTSTNANNGTSASATLTVNSAPAACATALSGVVNTYYPGTGSAAAGATSVTVGTAVGAGTALAQNDVVLIVQMQDATINSTNSNAYGANNGSGSGATSTGNSGLYEYKVVSSYNAGTVTFTSALTNSYASAAATSAAGKKTFQVIRVPVLASYTLSAAPTALAWNGSAGGVLAFDVSGTLTFSGSPTISVDGVGFSGGTGRSQTSGSGSNTDYRTNTGSNLANGAKGEGIAGISSASDSAGAYGYPNGSNARGAPGNAGGGGTDGNPAANDQNTGGGGGAGYGNGGQGGIGWCGGFNAGNPPNYGCSNSGGLGGTGITQSASRLTLGGGGGAATSNNATGSPGSGVASSGAAGGGLIFVRAGNLSGSAATFSAKGANANNTVCNDGSGGGGAGGAVLIEVGSGNGLNNVTINVNGGNGGTNLNPANGCGNATPHGPGGGGGGGYAITAVTGSGSATPAACNKNGGSRGDTYNNGTLFAGGYGSVAGSAGACSNTTGTIAVGATLGSGPCAPTVSHYAVGHSGSGITCEAEPVTITAHDATHARVDAGSKTITVTATNTSGGAATGTWVASDAAVCATTCYDTSGTAKASCGNAPTYTPAGTSTGVASYLFATGESGIKLCLKQSSAITQNINVSDGSATESAAEDPNLVFANTGFRFYANGSVDALGSLVAGLRSDTTDATYQPSPQTLTIRALKTSETTPARCVPLLGGTTKTVQFAYQCIDPATCQLPATGLEVNGTAVAGSGSVPTPASNVSVTFDASGYGGINLKYWDVGQIKLYAKGAVADATTGGTVTIATGSSNAFLVKPFGFSLIPCTALTGGACASAPANPGTTGGGTAIIQAGTTFNATVKAVAYDNTTVTPSFGLGTANGTESVVLSQTLVAPTSMCAGPSNCNGTLGGTTSILRSAFSAGVATVSDLTWSEVGVITLTATNSTFEGTTLVPSASGTSGNLGRFYPHHFGLTGAVQTRSDLLPSTGSTFTYMDEPMRMTLAVTAYNASEGVTQNYASGFAKLDAATLGTGANWFNTGCAAGTQCMGLGAVSGASGLSSRLAVDTTAGYGSATPTSSWAAGIGTFTLYAIFGRNGAPNGPYKTLNVGGMPQDSDGVSLPGPASGDATHRVNLDATTGNTLASNPDGSNERRLIFATDARYGKFAVANASGSERQSLPVAVNAWYYNGNPTGWVVNTDDALTPLPVAPFTPFAGNTTADACYTAACTSATGGGTNSIWLHDIGGTAIATATAPSASSAAKLAAGAGTLTLSRPALPGTLELTLIEAPWLRTNSGKNGTVGNYNWNPTGRITFGVYGPATNKSKFIYIRENY